MRRKKIVIVTKNKEVFQQQLQEGGGSLDQVEITLASHISETEHAIKYHEPWIVYFENGIRHGLLLDIIHEAHLVLKTIKARHKPNFILCGKIARPELPPGITSSVTIADVIQMTRQLSSN